MAFNLSSSLLQVAHISSQPRLQPKALAAASSRRPLDHKAESPTHLRSTPSLPLRPTGRSFRCSSSSNGRGDEDQAVKEVEKRRAELAARIASGEFTAQQPGWAGSGSGQRLEIPQARGSVDAVAGQAFFIPLYELFLTYGGIFRLNFGPKVGNGEFRAVYVALREAEMRSTSPIPTWEIPIWKDISPRQRKVSEALKLINTTLDDLIAICKVSSKQLRDDLMTMLIAGHETSAAVLTWTFYLLSKVSIL
ncbi:hypothetical protein BHE74_00044008 [Ensete ventricosum]|nr:hypothetical protein BHE74_00044008 [Ensete ventricosum]